MSVISGGISRPVETKVPNVPAVLGRMAGTHHSLNDPWLVDFSPVLLQWSPSLGMYGWEQPCWDYWSWSGQYWVQIKASVGSECCPERLHDQPSMGAEVRVSILGLVMALTASLLEGQLVQILVT